VPSILAAATLVAGVSLVPPSVWARVAAYVGSMLGGGAVAPPEVASGSGVDEAVLLALGALRHLRSYWAAYCVLATSLYWLLSVKPSIYLLDFAVFEAPESWRVTKAQTLELIKLQGCFTPESIEFQARLLERSGVGDATHWPPSIVQMVSWKEAKESRAQRGAARMSRAAAAPTPFHPIMPPHPHSALLVTRRSALSWQLPRPRMARPSSLRSVTGQQDVRGGL